MIRHLGIFLDKESKVKLRDLQEYSFAKKEKYPHVTLMYRPSEPYKYNKYIGKEYTIVVDGYGYDEKESCFRVQLPNDLKEIFNNYDAYGNEKTPHITVSRTSINHKSMKDIEYNDIEPFEVHGTFLYTAIDKHTHQEDLKDRLFLEPKEETIEDQLQKVLQNKGSKWDTRRKKNRFY